MTATAAARIRSIGPHRLVFREPAIVLIVTDIAKPSVRADTRYVGKHVEM